MHKPKLKEIKVGDVKVKSGIKSTVTDINPKTGAISWEIDDAPALDTTFEKFEELKDLIKILDTNLDDEVISKITSNVLILFNQYRTHLRKNYPETYNKYRINEDEVEEISTSGGAGAYNTPYAFKLVKKQKKISEDVGSTLGPGPKAGPKGVKDNYYVKAFGYKLVDRKKQAKNSKAVDYKDLWGKTYD